VHVALNPEITMNTEVISKAELAASVIAKLGKTDTKGEFVSTSVRVPSWVLAELDAMAAHSGQSRSQVINLVLGAGFEAIKVHLDTALLSELEQLSAVQLVATRAEGKSAAGSI